MDWGWGLSLAAWRRLSGSEAELSLVSAGEAEGLLVDAVARPEGDDLDHLALADPLDDAEAGDAPAPQALQLLLQRLPRLGVLQDPRERRANLPLDLGVEPADELGHASRNA